MVCASTQTDEQQLARDKPPKVSSKLGGWNMTTYVIPEAKAAKSTAILLMNGLCGTQRGQRNRKEGIRRISCTCTYEYSYSDRPRA